MFEINPLNPLKMVPVLEWDTEMYQTIPFDKGLQEEQTRLEYSDPKKYYQKFILKDDIRIQILSTYTDLYAEVRKCCDDSPGCTPEVVQEPEVVDTMSEITGNNSTCFELVIDCLPLGVGKFDLHVFYTDENEVLQEWVSEPFQTANEWPKTRCIEYTDSRNDGFIFQHKINDTNPFVGLIRVESDIIGFKPSSIDEIYADQVHNVTVVNGVAFRQFDFVAGGDGETIPDYRLDQINRIMLLNQVKYDGEYYTKSEGAQWEEVSRNPGERFSVQKISITESFNNFQYQLSTSGIGGETMAIQDTLRFIDNNTGSIVVNNKFKKYTLHRYISIYNAAGASFIITAQATSVDGIGDMPLQSFTIEGETIRHWRLEWPFDRPKTYTITWPAGIVLTIFVGYEYQDKVFTGGSGTAVTGGRIRSVAAYHGTPEEFELDFDTDTGLGIVGGPYEKCAVCDGQHGTPDLRDKMLIGTDGLTDLVDKPVNTTGGSWFKQILLNNLPIFSLKMFGAHLSGTPATIQSPFIPLAANDVTSVDGKGYSADDQYRMGKAVDSEPSLGRTSKIGGTNGDGTNAPGVALANFNVQGKYYRIIFWKQIA